MKGVLFLCCFHPPVRKARQSICDDLRPSLTLLGQRVDSLRMITREDKLAAIVDLKFPQNLQQLETYLGMTGAFRHYIANYTGKSEPLQMRKTQLLKGAPPKDAPRKIYSRQARIDEPTAEELGAFEMLRENFRAAPWLAHHDPTRQLHTDLDASKKAGHGAMVYHTKLGFVHTDKSKIVTMPSPVGSLASGLNRPTSAAFHDVSWLGPPL